MSIIQPTLGPSFSQKTWEFHNPVKIHFGAATRQLLTSRLVDFEHVWVVCPSWVRKRILEDPYLSGWATSARLHWIDDFQENPDLHWLQNAIDRMRHVPVDAIVALGGGSAIDSAKVLAVGVNSFDDRIRLDELLALSNRPNGPRRIPVYVMPTTSGTGSEVTPFATVWDPAKKKKYSLAGPDVFVDEAFVDPDWTDSLPHDVTLSTGLDAINQATESIWNRNANPITLSLATSSLQSGIPALTRFVAEGHSAEVRCKLAHASLLAGLAISQTRTALCHSMSYPMTSHFGVPHGFACAFTMPSIFRRCAEIDDGRLARLAIDLLGRQASTSDLWQAYRQLNESVQVSRRVQKLVPHQSALQDLVSEMVTPGRADNCVLPVSAQVLSEILEESWHGV